MIKVLYITSARLSFSRAHTRNIIKTAEYLNQEPDCKVVVFSSAAEPKSVQEIFESKGVGCVFPLEVSPRRRFLLFAIFRLRDEYDILYFRDPRLVCIVWVARFFLRKRVVFEAHGSHEWRFLKSVWLFAFHAAHGTVFITERLRQWYGADTARSVVTNVNALDDAFFTVDRIVLRKQTREQLQIPGDIFLMGYIGSTWWYKVDVLVAMLPQLAENIKLLLVGMKQDEEYHIRSVARTHGVEDRLVIRNRVPSQDVFSYLVASDVLLIPPTLMYPGSICSKIYEYLAAGVPIVAHPAGANDEVLHDGKNALLVPSTQAKPFADAVKRLQRDQQLQNSLGRQAVKDAKQYTWSKRAHDIRVLLQRVVFVKN